MKLIRRAMLALAAMVSMTEAAHANEWKMGPLTEQSPLSTEARELQDTDRREFLCLALNIYHEARGEILRGQQAVAHVVLNRRRAAAFPNSICGVVWQRSQFSWTVRPVGSLVPRDAGSWARSQEVALDVIKGRVADPTKGATHFHTRSIRPSWSNRARIRLNIGAHVFLTM